jgi:serine/threonine protein phosphatase PrpC
VQKTYPSFEVALRTDIGHEKFCSNEDSMIALIPRRLRTLEAMGAIFAVASGDGGPEYGASQTATHTISTNYYQEYYQANGHERKIDIADALIHLVKQANSQIYQTRIEQTKFLDEGWLGIFSSCAVAVLHEDAAIIAHVGNSRAYLIRQGQAKQLTKDHTLVGDLVSAGILTHQQAKNSSRRTMTNRVLGEKKDIDVDIVREAVQHGDILLLCTKGFTRHIDQEELGPLIVQGELQEGVERLIQLAKKRISIRSVGYDNVTIVAVRIS